MHHFDIFGSQKFRWIKNQLWKLFTDQSFSENKSIALVASRWYNWFPIPNSRILFLGSSYPGSDSHWRRYSLATEFAQASNLTDKWSLFDLLHVVVPEDRNFKYVLNSEEGRSFLQIQLELSIIAIEDLRPQIIVFCDSAALQYFCTKPTDNTIGMGYHCPFDDRFGIRVIESQDYTRIKYRTKSEKKSVLKGVPLLFLNENMQLDSPDYDLHVWQMRHVLSIYKWYFGANYPGAIGSVMNEFEDILKQTEEWEFIKSFYKRRGELATGKTDVERINAHIEKIRMLLVDLLRYELRDLTYDWPDDWE